jgi:hypothetical protein
MDEQRIKQAVVAVIERSLDTSELAAAVEEALRGPRPTDPPTPPVQSPGTQKLLERIVLSDILGDDILGARPNDPAFPLRMFFGDLGVLLARDATDDEQTHASIHAFTLASALNVFFRAEMNADANAHLAMEVGRLFYAATWVARMNTELVARVAPLLALRMNRRLAVVKLESVEVGARFEAHLHDRVASAHPNGTQIVRAVSFLCRGIAKDDVIVKAQVVT